MKILAIFLGTIFYFVLANPLEIFILLVLTVVVGAGVVALVL